jgi:L-2,4-diaminobutyric acid acetyltransferase
VTVLQVTSGAEIALSATVERRELRTSLLTSLDMTAATSDASDTDGRPPTATPEVTIEAPEIADGVAMHRMAAESGVLDVNSRYAYLIWCRDFAATSVVARMKDQVVGFVTGFRRPDAPDTLVVWQVAVDPVTRGAGVGGRMLDSLFDRVPGVAYMETTVTPDNESSNRMFVSFATRRNAGFERTELFSRELLGAGHEPEMLYRIGPIAPQD